MLLSSIVATILLASNTYGQDSACGSGWTYINGFGCYYFGPDAMTWDDTTQSYEAVLSIDAGTWEFKIADEGWSNPDFGPTGDPVVTLGSPTDIGTAIGANFQLALAEGGLFSFRLSDLATDLSSGTLTVTRVPVPAAFLLFGSALAGLGVVRRRK